MVQLVEQFQEVGRGRDRDWLRQQRQFARNREAQERRDKIEDKQADDLLASGTEIVMATETKSRDFEKKLGHYETMTVEALIENQKQLEAVQARIQTLLEQAYVMEDGRRVFKTEDGTQVFDEFGEELGSEVIDPDTIPDGNPTWEAFSAELEELETLNRERTELHEFQNRLDGAREEIAEGKIAEADLDALDAELEDLMPTSINGVLDASVPETGLGTPNFSDAIAGQKMESIEKLGL